LGSFFCRKEILFYNSSDDITEISSKTLSEMWHLLQFKMFFEKALKFSEAVEGR
jgi:hypothetical protein